MFKNNRNLFIIALIAVVNALGYGIIIPILYPYSVKFGLTDFQNGLLLAIFSLCQFLATPIIGRLSDKYGRKPLLVASISGTALSFVIMAFAPNALFLFIARALDGITAGNIPVASAVITDTTEPKDRARGFGIISASFGFGFIVGPIISTLTVGIHSAFPFLIAAAISTIAVIITALFLPETNRHIGQIRHEKLFNFHKLWKALHNKAVGATLLITFLFFIAFSMLIYSFQTVSVHRYNLPANQISLIFSIFGIMNLLAQLFTLGFTTKAFGIKKTLIGALIWTGLSYVVLFFTQHVWTFIAAITMLGLTNSYIQPLTQTILSEETDIKEQGEMLGVNASYMSIGQIIGPILAGGIVTVTSVNAPFLGSAVLLFICVFLAYRIFANLPNKVKITP